jgi:hypothetical protein
MSEMVKILLGWRLLIQYRKKTPSYGDKEEGKLQNENRRGEER